MTELRVRWIFGISMMLAAYTAVAQPCDPLDYKPREDPGAGFRWEYQTGDSIVKFVKLGGADERRKTGWELLPFCGCAWYPHTVPCPTCPPVTTQVTSTDTLTWTVSTTSTRQEGLALKFTMFAEIGWNGSLTQAEQEQLSGTHTSTVTTTFVRQPVLCFNKWYRQVWQWRMYSGARVVTHRFSWRAVNARGEMGKKAETTCKQETVGRVEWNTYPNYEWAPGKPPCGGIPIQNPDPWDGKREEPCCPDVCTPPPSPAHPCCGCEFHH